VRSREQAGPLNAETLTELHDAPCASAILGPLGTKNGPAAQMSERREQRS